jgi:putative nucleotidyltransferase with HDIG domain
MKEYVRQQFPMIDEIKDEDLKERVARVWEMAMQQGGWDTLENIPFTLLIPNAGGFVEHVCRVTKMAMRIAKEKGDVNHDFLIAGALLHDVGKLLEYKKEGKKVVKSDHGRRLRHPVSGAMLAMKEGLPIEVIHIIAAHSKEGEFVSRTKEAIIVHHCDFIDFETAKVV